MSDQGGSDVTGYPWLLLVVGMVHQQNNVLLRHIIGGRVQSPILGVTRVNPMLYIHEINYKRVWCFQYCQYGTTLVSTT
jgi:hypothetical protein